MYTIHLTQKYRNLCVTLTCQLVSKLANQLDSQCVTNGWLVPRPIENKLLNVAAYKIKWNETFFEFQMSKVHKVIKFMLHFKNRINANFAKMNFRFVSISQCLNFSTNIPKSEESSNVPQVLGEFRISHQNNIFMSQTIPNKT